VQKALEGAGAKDVKVSLDSKSATLTVPADMDMQTLLDAVSKSGKYSATVHQ
jgi:hypothetical protein